MRAVAIALVWLAMAGTVRAEVPAGAEERYEQDKKSVGLAIALEAISPIAGMGCFYGDVGDQATVLALVSTGAIGAGVGGIFWLRYVEHQHASGVGGVALSVEEGSAISLIVAAGLTYILARISGLSLAPDATRTFNEDLRHRVGLPPSEPTIPFHAWAPLPGVAFQF
ncbi:MAG TPA: hypothetical protein VLT58_01355 [Polyangia bacterium]|nr:hypothetical protein [Polyangia bacterium]